MDGGFPFSSLDVPFGVDGPPAPFDPAEHNEKSSSAVPGDQSGKVSLSNVAVRTLFGFFLLRPCPFLVELPRVRRPNSRRCKTGTAHIGVVQQRIIQTLMRRPCPAI